MKQKVELDGDGCGMRKRMLGPPSREGGCKLRQVGDKAKDKATFWFNNREIMHKRGPCVGVTHDQV